jgi:hypothetical protein
MLVCCFLGFIFSPHVAYAASITLVWDPSPDADVAGYRIYYGTESCNYAYPPVDVGNVTQYTINGLDIDGIYYFAVTAWTSDGKETPFSPEVSTFSEFAGTARLFARKMQFDSHEMQRGFGDSVEVYMAFNFLRPQGNFIFELEDIRITCHAGTFIQRDDNTLEAECVQKGPLGIVKRSTVTFSGTGNVSQKNPLSMSAEVYSVFSREFPLYVIEMDKLLPVP